MKGSIWVTRPAMVHYVDAARRTCSRWPKELFDHVLAGKHQERAQAGASRSAEAAEAHRALESRRTTGATVLVP